MSLLPFTYCCSASSLFIPIPFSLARVSCARVIRCNMYLLFDVLWMDTLPFVLAILVVSQRGLFVWHGLECSQCDLAADAVSKWQTSAPCWGARNAFFCAIIRRIVSSSSAPLAVCGWFTSYVPCSAYCIPLFCEWFIEPSASCCSCNKSPLIRLPFPCALCLCAELQIDYKVLRKVLVKFRKRKDYFMVIFFPNASFTYFKIENC